MYTRPSAATVRFGSALPGPVGLAILSIVNGASEGACALFRVVTATKLETTAKSTSAGLIIKFAETVVERRGRTYRILPCVNIIARLNPLSHLFAPANLMSLYASSSFSARARTAARAFAIGASVFLASKAAGHDYWLLPDMFAFPANTSIHVGGRQGTRFPEGRAIEAARIIDARIIGASSDMKITDMSVEGTSLRMHHKPTTAGQYLVAIRLTPRTLRTPPEGVIRFLRTESGVSEAARLEREKPLAGLDTVIYTATSYAATVVQVGADGPRAFSKTAGFPLEFVPVNDPAHLHVGDTLHIAVLGGGKPVPNIGIDALPAADTTAGADATAAKLIVTVNADAKGIVHLLLTKAGPWMLRSAYASHKNGGAANEWDVSRTSYVIQVGAKH